MVRPPRLQARRLAAALAGALGLLVAGPASAATILIDFNDNATAGFGWNTFHTGNDGTTQALIYDDGTASGFDIVLPTFNDSGNPGWSPANALPAWAPASVADDYSFFNAFFDGGTQTGQFVLQNLDPGLTYTIDMLMSRNLDRAQDITVTHGGGVLFQNDWNTQADGWVAGNLLTFSGLTADAANEIVIELRREGASAAFNAFRITTAAPEASTGGMLAVALGVALGARRRARS